MVRDGLPEDGSSDEPAPTQIPSAGRSQQRGDVTQILSDIEQGDGQAAEQLLPLVYAELRKLAAAKMAQEKPGQTLQATALVHEAFLRLVDVQQAQQWDSRGHFFSAAAEAMRRILVERARKKAGPRAGGGAERVELSDVDLEVEGPQLDLLALNEAIETLSTQDPRAAEIVKLRYFAGLTIKQTADLLQVSTATANSEWTYAKCWLRDALVGGGTDG